ncbi:hypothetical protein CCACVL1_09235 [Corchorus capsularis]|uniref:Uncharacterized protein n=1 Tax=Corchorus capsularis TaxID=210143 RepID=A0A1R3IX95_COCAP|nr:hypothetical protein CCACVL1_09235 [Corchorus capsularis]
MAPEIAMAPRQIPTSEIEMT